MTVLYTRKTPGEVLDYGANLGPHPITGARGELEDGETITSSSWTFDPPGELTVAQAGTHSDTAATIWLGGGVAGTSYRVTNTVTTSQQRTFQSTIVLTVTDDT